MNATIHRSPWTALVGVVLLGACTEAPDSFDRPTAVAFDPATREIVVSDGYNHSRVARFSRTGAALGAFGKHGAGDGDLRTPHGVAVDAEGHIYVADRENARVQVFDRDGHVLSIWNANIVGRPWSVAVGKDGYVYVVDGGDQDPARPRGGVVKLTRTGSVVARFLTHTNDGPQGLDGGHGIAIGADGSVYVAESDGQRVRKLMPVR